MTVGLVIVSHSAKIAEGVVELAAQMAPTVAIIAAGGTDDGGIGTSFDRVQAAFATADSGDGVIVLCDLGSAVLTAETALDFADAPERIRIADAPIVEGAVAAAVTAESGASLDAVLAAAQDQAPAAAEAAAPSSPVADPAAAEAGSVLEIELQNEHGLHARPAAELVRTASAYDAQVTVNGVDAKSMLRVLALGLDRGTLVRFEATGQQAAEAIAAIEALAGNGFGE
ncbi:dihydroxyacetone kinase phosphoryl donor subunit DhaM [Agrococcus sp. ARC_14]|uniref:dihydroxyacetone kinase phosphoryl donor subunit DhaM n=1 Tax=Agrococcus sp. ARC_14 TaxID=2919927 RepID=UPI001F0669E7|nr:PTS-dependent dihydroxyacetone kinase phosphotransferase subunit DhaM [Agrococcus sp. ARC_14]